MAIVCCNLLLGYTLIKSNAGSASGDFTLWVADKEIQRGTWDDCFATIKADPEKVYTIKMQSDWCPTTQIVLNEGTGCNIIFDLNGYTIDGSDYGHSYGNEESFFHSNAYDVAGNKLSYEHPEPFPNQDKYKMYFEFTDSSAAQTGTVKNFTATIFAGSNAGETELVISGGIFTQNNTHLFWNDIRITGGQIINNLTNVVPLLANNYVVIDGGEIVNNIANKTVNANCLIYTNGYFEMHGGKIIDNIGYSKAVVKCAVVGSSLYFLMTGGEIGGNMAPSQVCVESNTATATMTGGKIVGKVSLPDGVNFNIDTNNIDVTADGYFEHEYTKWEITKEATCEEDGKKVYHCATCDKTETEIIPALGHDWGEWIVDVEPTTTSTGHRYRVCKHDSNEIEEEIIPMLTPDEPEVPDDGEGDNNNGETGDDQTPTTPDDTEQPTETPKTETPENNTPWIMLFIGIGVGAVLLVGGITLGVVLSKRKSK